MFCLMNSSGKPLDDQVCNELSRLAREMYRTGKKRVKSTHRLCPGMVRTAFKSGAIGSISGTEFVAEIVTAHGETTVTYLMRSFDVEYDGPWGSAPLQALEELFAEHDKNEFVGSGRKLN